MSVFLSIRIISNTSKSDKKLFLKNFYKIDSRLFFLVNYFLADRDLETKKILQNCNIERRYLISETFRYYIIILSRLLLLLDKSYSAIWFCKYRISLAISLNNIYLLLKLIYRRVLIFQNLRNANLFVLNTVLRVISFRYINFDLRSDRQFIDCCSFSIYIVIA